MEGTNYSRLLRKQIGELMDLNETLVARVEQLKSYIHRSGFEVPLVEAGMSAPIIENTNSVEARGSKRQRTGVSGSYTSSHYPQDSIPWEMLENSILHSVREVISRQVPPSIDGSRNIIPRESQETNIEGRSDILNEDGNSSRNFERSYQNPDTSRALDSVSRSRSEPAERSMIKSETSQVNSSPRQSMKPHSRSIDDPQRSRRPKSRGSLSSTNGFSRNPAHNEIDQMPDYDQSEPSVGHLFDEPSTNGEPRNNTTFNTNGNLEEEDTLEPGSRNYQDENIMDPESRADTATLRGPEQSEQVTELRDNTETDPRESEPAEIAKQSNIRIEPEARLDEFQQGNQDYQENLRQEQEDLQYEQAELQIEEEPRVAIKSEPPQPESRLEQPGRRISETLPPLEEDRTPQRTPAQRSRFSELVASVAQPDPRSQREERPKLYGRYSEPPGAPAKPALNSAGTPLRPRPQRHSEHVPIAPMPPVPSSILRAFDKIQNSQSPPSEPKPASPVKTSQAGAGTGRFVPRMSNSMAPPETPQNTSNQFRTQNPSQSHTGPVGTSTPAPALKSGSPRDSFTEGSSMYQSAHSTFGDRENASVARSVSFKLPGYNTDNTSTDTLTPRNTPARLPRAPHSSEKPVMRPIGESSSQEYRVPSRRVLNSRNVYELDDSQASLPDMSEMKVNPGDFSEVRGRPKSFSQ